jgi:predicted peptidase
MNLLIFVALIGLLIIVLLPFFILSKKTSPIQPGMTHEILTPGYRRYTINVPTGYTGEDSVPLILALHFSGHGIPYYGELILSNLIEPAFRELEAVMVAPQPESEKFIFDLLRDVQKRFNIDSERILIIGYSLGGMGTYHFAGRYPDHFTAAIVMASSTPEDVLEIKWRIPLMVIHGRNDEVVSFQDAKNAVLRLEEKGVDVTFRVLEGVTHYETQFFVGALRNSIPWLYEKWNASEE